MVVGRSATSGVGLPAVCWSGNARRTLARRGSRGEFRSRPARPNDDRRPRALPRWVPRDRRVSRGAGSASRCGPSLGAAISSYILRLDDSRPRCRRDRRDDRSPPQGSSTHRNVQARVLRNHGRPGRARDGSRSSPRHLSVRPNGVEVRQRVGQVRPDHAAAVCTARALLIEPRRCWRTVSSLFSIAARASRAHRRQGAASCLTGLSSAGEREADAVALPFTYASRVRSSSAVGHFRAWDPPIEAGRRGSWCTSNRSY